VQTVGIVGFPLAREFQEEFADERRGLPGVTRAFAAEQRARQLAQARIDRWGKALEGSLISGRPLV
jgi:hypothetical protein